MTKKAFLVGANTLGLKYAEEDVKLMKEALIKYGYEVVSPPASKSAIMSQLDDLIDSVAKTDTVIFYFSGHGHTPKGELLLVVEDELQKTKSHIHIHYFIEALENCRAENKLMVLDCCKADAAAKEWNPEQSERYRILTASERLERGKEIDQFQASFLTHYLHHALVSDFHAVVDRDGIIRVNTLYEWLKSQAQSHNAGEHTTQVPIPNLLGNQKANFEVGVVKLAHKDLIPPSPNKLTVSDWGNALDISNFYGRQQDFTDLEQWMKLCKKQRKRLLQALGQAFTNLNDLNILCFQAFGIYVQHITTTDDGIPIILGKILQYAELHHRLFELIDEACILQPNDLALQSVKKHFEPFLEEEILDPYEALLLRGNRAMIDRKVLRDTLRNFNNLSGKPVLITNGPPDSGKTYTKYLLYYLEAATHAFRTMTIDCDYLAARSIDKIITAELVGQRIAAQLLLEDIPKREKEEEVRWVMKFCNWLMIQLRDTSLPHWLILDHIYKVQFSEGAHDLLHELIALIDENKLNIRLLLLGYPEIARLRPSFSDIIVFEELQYMTPKDFFAFFYQLYELRKQSKRYQQKDFTDADIAESIVHVVSNFAQGGQYGKEALGDILMPEINKIFQQPAPASPPPEMEKRVMAIVQKRLAHIHTDPNDVPTKRYNAYFEAAAVLSTFQSKTLKSVDGEENNDDLQDVLFASLSLPPTQEMDSYTLLPETRREVLQQLGSREALLHALDANPDRPQDVTQRLFEAYVNGTAPSLQDHDVQHIAVAAQVVTWLRDIIADLPEQDAIQQRQDFCNLIQPFHDLMGPFFRGRESELAKLRNYIGIPSPDSGQEENSYNASSNQPGLPILIYGVGGIGKSTLIARLIWEYATLPSPQRFSWAYINFDRPGLLAEEPITLLIEAVRQLGIQYPHARIYCDRFCESMKKSLSQRNATTRIRTASVQDDDLIHGIPSTRTDWISYIRDFASLLKNLQVDAKTFLFVLDTLEEVQYHSYVSVEELCHFLRIFLEYVPQLRVVLGSRVPLADSLEFPTEKIQLENFDPLAAQGFLEAHGLPADVAQAFVNITDGNPLSLTLATEVWRLEKNNPLPEPLSQQIRLIRSNEAKIQSMLYTRILDHIHDADVRKLAHPGLVLRRITPDIISKVLAKVCGIPIQSPDDAQKLFDEMQREVALVTLENGALRHRSDVRHEMLRLIRAKEPEKVRNIEEAAIEYYSQLTDPESRAEEIYHRLSQNQSRTFLETRWQDSTGIEAYLYSTLDELSIRSKTWLAIHLNIALTPTERVQAELADWEHDTEKYARRLLQHNDPIQVAQALKILHERNERIANSNLYLLEAQVLERLQDWEQALAVLTAAINITTDHMLSIDLRLQNARIHIRQRNIDQAQSCLDEIATLLALSGPDALREIDVTLLRLKLQRTTGQDIDIQGPENSLHASLGDLFTRLTDEQIAQHSLLMIRFACALGEEYPACLLPIIRHNYLFSRKKLPLRHLYRALIDWDSEVSRGRGEHPGTLARWIELPEQPTLAKTWEQIAFLYTPKTLTAHMVQLLEAFGNPPLAVCTAFVTLLCERAQDLSTSQNETPESSREKQVEADVEPPASAYEANKLRITFTNEQRRELVDAFMDVFPTRERVELMVDYRLDRRLETIAFGSNLKETILSLIQAAEAGGWLLDLIVATIESNPHNARLRHTVDALDLLLNSQLTLSQTVKASFPRFEAKSVFNPTQFNARIGELVAQIGRIESYSDTGLHTTGTGFLIGSDMFMTACHNVTSLQSNHLQTRDIVLYFDYKVSSDGGTRYQIAPKDWLIDYDEQLDYAILRVSGTPGLDPIGGERAELDAPARGWVTIPITPPVLSPGTPVVILYYSEDSSLKVSLDTSSITDISSDGTHIQYRHSTSRGSSGAPCFNSNWELIAIHQQETINGYGMGTTLLALMSLLKTRGILDTLQTVIPSAKVLEDLLPDTTEPHTSQQEENDLADLENLRIYIREAYNRISQVYHHTQSQKDISRDEITYLIDLLDNLRKNTILADKLKYPINSRFPLLAIQEQINRSTALIYALSQDLTSLFSANLRSQRQRLDELQESLRRLLDQLQDLEQLLESH